MRPRVTGLPNPTAPVKPVNLVNPVKAISAASGCHATCIRSRP
jgi:hypothetical protein